ncbi:hypothetical protein WMY93_015774 [Mugilogobius chulae]|uniref:Uncharacterized protein n=1 Tax=Mugilogobius chulae TaxID=88201 RepID=A0AAW0NTN5_9GOBI
MEITSEESQMLSSAQSCPSLRWQRDYLKKIELHAIGLNSQVRRVHVAPKSSVRCLEDSHRGPLFAHLEEFLELSWVMYVYPSWALQVTPSCLSLSGQHLRVAISKVSGFGEAPGFQRWAPVWLLWRERLGAVLARHTNVFRSTDFWQHRSI